MSFAVFIIASGIAEWTPEQWILAVVGIVGGVLGALAKYESARNKSRIAATDNRAASAEAKADQAQQTLSDVKTQAQVADAKADIANTRVANVAQVANAARSDVTRVVAQMPPQPWYPSPTDAASGANDQSSGQ